MTASKKKIVIVGVSGLLGRSLFNIIGKKKNILGTYFKNKPNLKIKKLLKCNLENLNSCLVITKNCKNLYMCGGPVFSKNGKITEEEFFFKNSKIFLNLFIAAIKNKVNTITWVSSAKVYKTSRGKLSENSTKNNIFGFNISSSYQFIEKVSDFLNKLKIIKIYYIRTGNIYGPHDHFKNKYRMQVIPRLINQIYDRNNQTIKLDKNVIRDFTFGNDLSKAMILLTKHKKNLSPVNFSLGKGTSIYTLATIIQKSLSARINLKSSSQKKDIVILNNKKFNNNFKNFKRTKLYNGVHKTLHWYLNEKN